jgi:hypothetical protein
MGRDSLLLFRIFESVLYHERCFSLRPTSLKACYSLAESFYFG